MDFPFTVELNVPHLFGGATFPITFNSGLVTLIGPNASGKTQVLRELKKALGKHADGKKVRFLCGGRLAPLETFRADLMGEHAPTYDNAHYGGRDRGKNRFKAESAWGDLHALAARADLQIKVRARLQTFFGRDIELNWDTGSLRVFFKGVDSATGGYSSSREASGILQLVSLLAAIYDDEVGVLLIDEPELSLHPQYQSLLLREMLNVTGKAESAKEGGESHRLPRKIICIATHSPSMVHVRTPADLAGLVFFQDTNTKPKQVSPDADELRNKKLHALIARLGETHKVAFFASRPLLVEGDSDAIVVKSLNHRLSCHLEAAGGSVVPVYGKDMMPVVVKLFRLVGKNPAVVVDLDAFADDNSIASLSWDNAKAKKRASELGHRDLPAFTNDVKSDLYKAFQEHDDEIWGEASKHRYWHYRSDEDDEAKARRRAMVATLLSVPRSVLEGKGQAELWCGLRERLDCLLDVLETAGCFVLRKGALEDYHGEWASEHASDKMAAAIDASDWIMETEPGLVRSAYDVLVRALEACSPLPPIGEQNFVSDLLLAVAAPALRNFGKATSDEDLNRKSREVLGERSSLFRLRKKHDGGECSEPRLEIELQSSILDVEGFPVEFGAHDNPNDVVEKTLGRKAEKPG